ncbi:MAG: SET domain-containing protein-lysine N-methyltransferase [Gammaproteobacteria bacterium]|nr:SET domain-containing protein-lysine N-methyltransferase [Gammaproteobacteria bacterium]
MSSASPKTPLYKVRNSKIHGRGVFAARRIRKGTKVIEYVGERVSHAEADRRYEDKAPDDNHTFLFIVDGRTVIDAGVDGNEARFINHACDPNCETVTEQRRIFIYATRTIQPGEELSYDYQIKRDRGDPPELDQVFACHCGAANCRGTMIQPPDKPKRKSKAKTKAKAKAKTKAKTKAKAKAKTKAKAERHAHGRSVR